MYVTVKQSPRFHQISFEDLLSGSGDSGRVYRYDPTSTRTYISDRYNMTARFGFSHIYHMIDILRRFNLETDHLRSVDRASLYHSYRIPKSNGKMRQIDEPMGELKEYLRRLKYIFDVEFPAVCEAKGLPLRLYHTSTHAYVSGRSNVTALKKHQANESKWFTKLDLHDFFGSTTLEFIMNMFSMIYPFSEIIHIPEGKAELEKALELGMLRGGLPQGSPLSPSITVIMMIPIDFELSNKLQDFNGAKFVYVRYADDFIISSRYSHRFRDVERLVESTLASYNAPFQLNQEKTRYGSCCGQNWNLGLMLNKDNDITVGYKNKRRLRNSLYNYYVSRGTEDAWDVGEIQHTLGIVAYYAQVEGKERIDKLISATSKSVGVENIVEIMKDEIRVMSKS